MNVGCNLRGFGASSMTPQCHLGSTKGNPGKYLGLGERIYHKLMNWGEFSRETLQKQLQMMWVNMCVALWEVWGQHTVEGGP